MGRHKAVENELINNIQTIGNLNISPKTQSRPEPSSFFDANASTSRGGNTAPPRQTFPYENIDMLDGDIDSNNLTDDESTPPHKKQRLNSYENENSHNELVEENSTSPNEEQEQTAASPSLSTEDLYTLYLKAFHG